MSDLKYSIYSTSQGSSVYHLYSHVMCLQLCSVFVPAVLWIMCTFEHNILLVFNFKGTYPCFCTSDWNCFHSLHAPNSLVDKH